MSLLVLISALLALRPASAALLHITPTKSHIEFVGKGRPALISITGSAPFSEGSLNLENGSVSGTLRVPMTLITTGIDLRDEHLKEKYLEVAKFPHASLELQNVILAGKRFEGKLTLHGVEQKIAGTTSVTTTGSVTTLHAEFSIKLSDYKISIPSFKGITVADVVTIKTELTMDEKK